MNLLKISILSIIVCLFGKMKLISAVEIIKLFDSKKEICTQCFCDSNLSLVDCSEQKLEQVPSLQETPFNIHILILNKNKIRALRKQDFVSTNLIDLEELYVVDNELSIIEDGSFEALQHLKKLDLTKNRLDSLSETNLKHLNVSLSSLNLSLNVFTSVIFEIEMNNLKELFLDFNSLQDLTECSFIGLPNLQTLSFNYNPISSLDENGLSLKGLNNLVSLTFNYTLFSTLPISSAFSPVSKTLKYLSFSHNYRLQRLQSMNLTHLRSLDISNCNLETLQEDYFVGLEELEFLDISYSEIYQISDYAFAGLKKLKFLNLSGNLLFRLPFKAFNKISSTLKELFADSLPLVAIPKIQDDENGLISLTRLSLSFNQISFIHSQSFFNFLNQLTDLRLSYTKLEFLPYDCLKNLSALKRFEFTGNLITSIGNITEPILPLLEVLSIQNSQNLVDVDDLSFFGRNLVSLVLTNNQQLKTLSKYALDGFPNLERIDISENKLETAHEDWFLNKPLKFLSMSGNSWRCDCMMTATQDFLLTTNCTIDQQPTCYFPRIWREEKIIEVTNMTCEPACPDACLCYGHNNVLITSTTSDIVTVNCEAEEIESFPQLNDYNIQNLHLGDNQIKDLKPETFDNFTQLQTLNLNGNEISTLQISNKPLLRLLDLSNNKIQNLGSDLFMKLNSLEVLVLSYNKINLQDEMFYPLINLRLLHISFNQLMSIPSVLVSDLLKLKTLYLDGNNFVSVKAEFLKSDVLEYINLDSCNIKEIEENAFTKLPKLQTLRLARNNIKLISESWFGLNHDFLHSLDLGYNTLSTIPLKSLECFTNLSSLVLRSNDISDISNHSNKSFINLRFSLNLLDVSENPLTSITDSSDLQFFNTSTTLLLSDCKLKTFPNEVFDQLPLLEAIYIDGNEFTTISKNQINLYNQLKRLDLRFMNQLEKIEDYSFKMFPNLEVLEISNCLKLSQIEEEAFKGLENLQILDLSFNNLTVPQPKWFKDLDYNKLLTLAIYGNPWSCDCQAEEYLKWMKREECFPSSSVSSVICQSPDNLAGLSLETLSSDDICISTSTTGQIGYSSTSFQSTEDLIDETSTSIATNFSSSMYLSLNFIIYLILRELIKLFSF